MPQPLPILEDLKAEVERRIFQESIPRIKKCLAQLDTQEIWFKANANSNSVGNLVLHLCGNARQWIVAGLTEQEDTRNRDAEFNETGPIPTESLLRLLNQTQDEVQAVLNQLHVADLFKTYQVQGFQEKGLSILIHVVEHFSYHTGQITYFTKLRKNMDMGYYANLDLN